MHMPEASLARAQRPAMTSSEMLLWRELRAGRLGLRFRRQHPVGPYVVAFYCAPLRLVVEVDGASDGFEPNLRRDHVRDHFLEENGYRVLRIAAADVQRDVTAAVAIIAACAARPLCHAWHGPPARSGEA